MSALPSNDWDTPLSRTLASYLPAYQSRLLQNGLRPGPEPFCEEKPGVILLVDVSGFTALTERFAQQGAAGAEQLSAILNRYFGRVTEIIAAQGGDVIAFAGDSALAMWPSENSNLVQNAARAAQCALRIQSELDGYVPVEGVALRQRAGIGCGTLRLMELGGLGGRWQFIVTGRPITDASLANREADPGDVVLSAEAAKLVRDCIGGALLPSGLFRVRSIEALAPLAAPGDSHHGVATKQAADLLHNYVPRVVADRLGAGQEQWMAEFRTLSVLFLNLAENDVDNPSVAGLHNIAGLHRKVRRIQESLQAYEGTLYQFLMDDKGLTAVCAFGLPPLAHEDDARRAAEAALSLRDELAAIGAATSAGIATGTVFCGVYGNDSRRQYTALGNTMNLAARLMQAAASGVLCDMSTYRAAQSAAGIRFEAKGEMSVKGRSAPVAIFAPSRTFERDTSAEVRTGVDIIGREVERAAVGGALQSLIAQRESACIILEGEAGIGKTRILEDFADHVREVEAKGHRIPCWHAAGDSIEQTAPYLAWRGVFREVFQLSGAPGSSWRDRVLAQLSGRKDLLPLAPLLNVVLPLDIPATSATAAMEGQALAETTQHLLVTLLQSAADPDGVILLMDDAHWFDSASWRLALLAMQQVRPLILVLATRPMADPPQEFLALIGMGSTKRFLVQPLDSDLTLSLVCQRLGVNRLPPEIARFITEKGKGHPLFSEQLGYALRDAGLILISGRQCQVPDSATGAAFDAALAAVRFPSTLEGVITVRLDRLAPEAQLTVKIASVIGQRFSGAALRGVHPVASRKAPIGEHLESAEKLELIRRIPNDSDGYLFAQAITHEVSYNSVPFAQRRQIHRSIGEWLEHEFSADLAGHCPLLAHHWLRAEEPEKAIHYCSEAGSQALRNNANQEAVRFLSDALKIDEQQGAKHQQRAEWELQIGKAYTNWSKYIEARAHLERGLRLQGLSVPAGNAGTAVALLGQVIRQCLHRSMPARFVGRRKTESESLLKFSRTFEALTEIYYLQDMSLQCLLAVFRSLNLAELAGSSPELARGYSSAGSLVGFMTLHKAANKYFDLAGKICQHIDHPASRAWVSLARAMYLAGVGQWELAAQLLNEAMSINDGIGDRRRGDDNRMTLSIVQHLQGRFAESLVMADTLYKSAGDRLDVRCQAEALRIKAYDLLVMDRMTELRDCVDELDSLRTAQVKFGGTHQKQDVHALNAILALSEGNLQAASESAERSLKALSGTSNSFFDYLLERSVLAEVYLQAFEADPESSGGRAKAQQAVKALHAYTRVFPIGRPLATLHQGRLFWLEGKKEKAVACWKQILESANDLKAPYYEALAHEKLGVYGIDLREKELHLDHARDLFKSLNAARDLARLQPHSEA